MFAGHMGAGLAIGRLERRVNVGVFITAALLLDFVLWFFVLLGWESVTIPDSFASTHQPRFVFPYSHSLLAGFVWSALAGAVAFASFSRLREARTRAAILIAAAVFSHWLLDALVHQPEMPLAGDSSPAVGLGLWNSMSVALAAEAGIAVLGLFLFIPGSGLSRRKSVMLAALCIIVLAFTIAGMTIAPPPPSARAMAASSLFTLMVVCALAFRLGKQPAGNQTGS
jgi:hypothetical protein